MQPSRYIAAAGLLLAASLSAASFAQSTPPQRIGRMDTHLYVGATLGNANYRNACDGVGGTCDDSAFAKRIFGGLQFHPNVAVEIAYFDLGKVQASDIVGGVVVDASAKVSGYEAAILGILPVWRDLSVIAKVGVARSRVVVSSSGSIGNFAASTTAKDRSTDVTFGVGAQYNFTPNWAARAEWQRYNGVGGSNSGKDDIDLYSGSLLYRF